MKFLTWVLLAGICVPVLGQVIVLKDGSRFQGQVETWGLKTVEVEWTETGESLRLHTDAISSVIQEEIVPEQKRVHNMAAISIPSSSEHPVWSPRLQAGILQVTHSWGQVNEMSADWVQSLSLPVPAEQWKVRGPLGKEGWISTHGPDEPADFAAEWGWVRGKLVRQNTLFQHIRHPLGVLPAKSAVRFRMVFPEGEPSYELYLHKGASPFPANALLRLNVKPNQMRLLATVYEGAVTHQKEAQPRLHNVHDLTVVLNREEGVGELYAGDEWVYTWKRFEGEKEGAYDQEPMFLQVMFRTHLPVIVDTLEVYEWNEHPFSEKKLDQPGVFLRNGDVLEATELQLDAEHVLATVSRQQIPIKPSRVKSLKLDGEKRSEQKPVTTFYTAYRGEVFPCTSFELLNGTIRAESDYWGEELTLPLSSVSEIAHHGTWNAKPAPFRVSTYGGSQFLADSIVQEGDELQVQTTASPAPLRIPVSAIHAVERIASRDDRLEALDQTLTELTEGTSNLQEGERPVFSTLHLKDGSLLKVSLQSIQPEGIRVRTVWGEDLTLPLEDVRSFTTGQPASEPGWVYELGLPRDWMIETRMPGGKVRPIHLNPQGHWLTDQQLIYKRDLPKTELPVLFRFRFPDGDEEVRRFRFLALELVPTGVTSAAGLRLYASPRSIQLQTRNGRRSIQAEGFTEAESMEVVLSPSGEVIIRLDGKEVGKTETEFTSLFQHAHTLKLRTGAQNPFHQVQVYPVEPGVALPESPGLRLWSVNRFHPGVSLNEGREGSLLSVQTDRPEEKVLPWSDLRRIENFPVNRDKNESRSGTVTLTLRDGNGQLHVRDLTISDGVVKGDWKSAAARVSIPIDAVQQLRWNQTWPRRTVEPLPAAQWVAPWTW